MKNIQLAIATICLLQHSNCIAKKIAIDSFKFTSTQFIGQQISAGGGLTFGLLAGVSYKKIDVTLGVNLQYYINDNSWSKNKYYPVYINTRVFPFKKRNAYAFLEGGPNFLDRLRGNNQPRFKTFVGTNLSGGLGMKRKFAGETFYIMQIGYGYNYLKWEFNSNWNPNMPPQWEQTILDIRSIDFKFGICF